MVREIARKSALALVLATLVSPALAAEAKAPTKSRKAAPAVEGVVNINTASIEELALLPGIGEATAQRIVDHRQKNGSFKSPEEIMNVRGIGESTFSKLRANLAVTGATTVAPPAKETKDAKSAKSAK